jgi:hypothetical protein
VSRYCEDCGADISHKGNRAKRCDEHQRAFHAARERGRYDRVKDTISTRRILRRRGAADYEPAEVPEFGGDGRSKPPTPDDRPRPWRQPPHLDHNTRVRMQKANSAEADMSSWANLQATRNSGRYVTFNAPSPEPAPDPWGRSTRRSRGHFSGKDRGGDEIPIVRSSGAGERAVAQQQVRFGGRVEIRQAQAGMLCAPPPTMVQAEQRVAEQHRQASEHVRTQAGYNAWSRR